MRVIHIHPIVLVIKDCNTGPYCFVTNRFIIAPRTLKLALPGGGQIQ